MALLAFRAAVIATGLISGHPVVVCDVIGSNEKFRAYVIRELLRANGSPVSENQMKRAVSAELKRQQIRGATIEGSAKRRWLILADKEMIHAMPAGLSPSKRAEWLASSLKTVDKLEALNLSRWRAVINEKVRFGVVAGILQAISLTKLIADQEKALTNENEDATMRMYAGTSAILATTSDIIGNALFARANQGLRFGEGLAKSFGGLLKKSAGPAGMLAGLYVAWLDFKKARSELSENADGLVVVSYLASGVIGGLLSIFLLSSVMLGAAAIPVIGILIILLIGVGILIEYIKDNPLQDWLERCPWGSLPNQRYPDMETEQAQLQQAVK